ncbi:MAG: cation:proton antiporter [Candidatus Glassbacteria bacterium]
MHENNLLEITTHLVLQLAVILFAAKIAAEIFVRYLKQPAVLGELIVGMILGPYALGSLIPVPGMSEGLNTLFPLPNSMGGSHAVTVPVSNELWVIGQIAVVILLFIAGLETDLDQFIRYGFRALVIAIGGVIAPFLLGAYATVAFGFAASIMDPVSLFMGAIMTATSVGITARVLSDIGKIATPEGVTILAGAVVDDVLGILVLAIVVSISKAGAVSTSAIGLLALKAFGFWLGLTTVSILMAKLIARALEALKTEGASMTLALGLCFLIAAITELFGLAMIIGAYMIGLALSNTEIAERLEESLRSIYHAFVPIFFVVMGMLVDFRAMQSAILFGVVISILAIISKVFGCGIPALGVGFNMAGSFRIGIGMLPRGEVALIIAGVGLASGVIDNTIFGVSIMMTFVTTLMAPIILVPIFKRGGHGRRVQESSDSDRRDEL